MRVDVRQLKDRAAQAYEKGKYKKAADLFVELCKAEPAEPGWPHRAAELLRKRGRNAEAVGYLTTAADLYARQGFLLKAVAVCKIILAIDPAHAAARALLPNLLAKLAKPQPNAGPRPSAEVSDPEPAPAPAAPERPAVKVARSADDSVERQARPLVLHEDDRLAALPLGRIVPGAHVTADMPALRVIEIPLEDDDRAVTEAVAQAAALGGPVPTVAPGDELAAAPVDDAAPAPRAAEGLVLDAAPAVEVDAPIEVEPSGPRPLPQELPRIPLFSSLGREQLRRLIERVEVLAVSDGDIIFAEGEPGDALYVVVRGVVKVLTGTGGGAEVLDWLEEGAFFGEVSLISGTPHTATAVADGDATLMKISRQVINGLLAEAPEVLQVLLGFFRTHLVNLLLASSPMFTPFTQEDRRRLAGRFRFVEIEAEATIIEEGEPAPGLFIVLAGDLRVTARRDGRDVQLATLSGGDVCGEMSLLARVPAMASIQARTKCWALVLGRQEFSELIMTHPQVLAFISDLVEQRRRENVATLGTERPYREDRVPVY